MLSHKCSYSKVLAYVRLMHAGDKLHGLSKLRERIEPSKCNLKKKKKEKKKKDFCFSFIFQSRKVPALN